MCGRRLAPASYRVGVEPVRISIDRSQGAARLSADGAASSGRLILGIASARMQSSFRLEGAAITSPITRRQCMRAGAEVRLSVNPVLIRVASEHAEGSCAYGLTLTHEMKHVDVYARYLEQLAPDIEKALRASFGESIFVFPDRAHGEREMSARLDAVVRPLIEAAMREAEQQQATIDSREEYARLDQLQARCIN